MIPIPKNQLDPRGRARTSMMVIALLGTGALTPTIRAAAQTGGVREVSASARTVIQLDTRLRFTTMVVLPENEEILDIICGDKDYWVISAAQNIAHIKPAKEAAATNLNLVASSGVVYSFLLTERANTPPDLKVYVTGETNAVAKPRYYAASQLATLEAEINVAHEAAAAARRSADEAVTAFRARYPTSLKFVYRASAYEDVFRIRALWHDGTFTYIKSDAPELPALYEVVDDEPALVNFEVRNGFYVVPKVIERGYLAIGKKHFVFFVDK